MASLISRGAAWPPPFFKKARIDRKSTRLNSSHLVISYAVFCLKKEQAHRRLRVEVCGGEASVRLLTYPYELDRMPRCLSTLNFFFNDTATTEIYTLSLHDALPI